DQWLPDKLAAQLAHLRSHPEVGLVHTNTHRYVQPSGELAPSDLERKKTFVGRCSLAFFDTAGITTSSVMVRRGSLDVVGTFDVTLPPCEDLDLWMRISRKFDLAFIDTPLVLFRYFPAGGSNLSNNRIMMTESEIRVWAKAVKEDRHLIAMIGPGRV